MLLRQRIVFLGSQVDDYTADFIVGQLLYLDAEDPKKDIKLFINSPGGSVTAAMGIYDAMKLCKADVSTICMGLAASMGAFILATGTNGKRFCMPNARLMIHQQRVYPQGEGIEMSIQVRETSYQNVKLKKILSRVTGKPVEQIENDTEGDFFMNPWEAKEYGLVDEIIDDGKPGLVAPLADSSPPSSTGATWFLWGSRGHGRPAVKDLPSEEKMSQNGEVGGSGADEVEQEKEAPSPV